MTEPALLAGDITTKCGRAGGSGIAMVLHDLRGGGAERACLRLARGMVEAGRHVELILVQGKGVYLPDIPAGVTLTVLNRPRVSRAVGALARHLRKNRPRVVLSALTHMNLATVLAARLSGANPRIVLSERNQLSAKAQDAKGPWQHALYSAVPLAYRAADAVVAVSGGVAADLVRFGRLPVDRIHVIHNPVFDPALEKMAQTAPAHPWFGPDTAPVILAAGRLHRQKGFDALLRAFAIVRARMDCRLVILGEGDERAALMAAAARINPTCDIDMPGFVSNPFALMARADAFVLSSRWEGFPNALVEAMACGAPVIATDCPSGPREILDGGRYGLLVPVDDVESLAAALLDTLSNRPGTAASQARAQSYSITRAAAQYLDALEA